MASGRTGARSAADCVSIDMEHSPLNMDAVNQFVAYASDKAYVAQRGDTQPRTSIVARFPRYARKLTSSAFTQVRGGQLFAFPTKPH